MILNVLLKRLFLKNKLSVSKIPPTIIAILKPLSEPFEERNKQKNESHKISLNEDILLSENIFALPLEEDQNVSVSHVDSLTPDKRYLWILDDDGFKVILESTPCDSPRKCACHTNITQAKKAYHGGELWFHDRHSISLNFSSGRYNTRTEVQDNAVKSYFEIIGFSVILLD